MAKSAEDTLEMEEDTQKGRFLTFLIGKETYGIEIQYVTEIIEMQIITAIPEQPDYVKGVINLRGKIIPIMDVRVRFKKEFKEYNDRTCVIVVDIKNASIGFIVDRVSDVLTIPEDSIVDPPKMSNGRHYKYIKNIGKIDNTVLLLLDCELLLTEDEWDNLSEAV